MLITFKLYEQQKCVYDNKVHKAENQTVWENFYENVKISQILVRVWYNKGE